MKSEPEDLATSIFRVIDPVVEVYLGSVVKPFVKIHEKFYSSLNTVLRKVLDDNAGRIPPWFTANFITYFRTALVVPTLLLLAWDYNVIASIIVLLVDFGDFLDGVVARFWVDENTKALAKENTKDSKDKPKVSPANSDDESFGKFY
jgi:CDP-alcohol phosphatidyltransferase